MYEGKHFSFLPNSGKPDAMGAIPVNKTGTSRHNGRRTGARWSEVPL